jgi:hypothetical protein
VLWKVIRRLLAVFIRAFIWHPVLGLSIVVVALGAIGFGVGGLDNAQLVRGQVATQNNLTSPASLTGTPAVALATPSVQPAPPMSPAPAVDEYIKGMTSFDAQLMWDSLDPTAIQAMVSQGGSQQALQQRLDDAKQNGARYEGVTYVGGFPLQNGDSYMFYVVSRRGFAGPGVFDQVFFVFTVGPNGKILKIE